jgi:hypothetical protein
MPDSRVDSRAGSREDAERRDAGRPVELFLYPQRSGGAYQRVRVLQWFAPLAPHRAPTAAVLVLDGTGKFALGVLVHADMSDLTARAPVEDPREDAQEAGPSGSRVS